MSKKQWQEEAEAQQLLDSEEQHTELQNEQRDTPLLLSRRKMLAALGAAGVTLAAGSWLQASAASAKTVGESTYGPGTGLEDLVGLDDGLLATTGHPKFLTMEADLYDVKRNGAVGDGITDDTAAIQNTIAEAAAAGGGTVYFPVGGVYRITATLVIPAGVALASQAARATIAAAAPFTGDHMLEWIGSAGSRVSDLIVDGNGLLPKALLYWHNCQRVFIEHVDLLNNPVRYSALVRVEESTNVTITGCRLDNGYIGMDIRQNNSHLTIQQCEIAHIQQTAIRVSGDETTRTDHSTIRHCKIHTIVGTPGTHVMYPIYYTCNKKNNKHRSVHILYNEVIGNGLAYSQGGNADMLALYDIDDGIVSGNIVVSGGDVGVSLSRSSNVTVSDNVAAYNNTVGIGVWTSVDCTVTGNIVYNNYQNYGGILTAYPRGGIRINGDATGLPCENVSVVGNRCYDNQPQKTQDYGIFVEGRASNVHIGANQLSGNRDGMLRSATADVHLSFTISADAPPSEGYWEKGMIVVPRQAGSGILHWICTAAGTPGQWQAVAAEEAVDRNVYMQKINDTQFHIWMKSDRSVRWARYHFRRLTSAATNLDAWRIFKVEAVDLAEANPLLGTTENDVLAVTTTGSNFEYAIKLDGAPDFFGGLHGDEQLQQIAFIRDGTLVPLAEWSGITACDRLEIVQHTVMYNPSLPASKTGDMHARYIFSGGEWDLHWKFIWAGAYTVTLAYGAMLPAVRSSDVSSRFRYIDEAYEYDISTAYHGAPGKNSYGVVTYNAVNGLDLSVELTDTAFFNQYAATAGKGIWVYGGTAYNKIYPSRVYTPHTEAVAANQIWHLSAKYRVGFRADS
ncbi:right-handed parallel beta-helix repeat-containing protein [Paenibacillus sp. J5C_2022]|uniref:right-handed parallel beta-helix repeat-containing protein n=1 Tax=Paenibacillus sp. J5C2022 TaxID=2977129 RepID=UPI0021D210A5|nr:glycosyl hydrolase family 28-related protein [Paenibacillus sp. J5C2022]MCU6712819.1 right-handed parallel beta-helix repeat-containing protein [Paenibacillus sp. J5C2022]